MKKLMIAAVIVCTAAFAQAASFDWGMSSTEWQGGTYDGTYANYGAHYALYLVDSFTEIQGYDPSTGKLMVDGVALSALDTYDPTNSELDNGAFLTDYTAESVAALNGKNIIAIVYDPESVADKYAAAVYAVSGLDDGGQPKALYLDGVGDSNFTTSTHLSEAPLADIAPEPTSGLLLLIGVAGLALKRRRA